MTTTASIVRATTPTSIITCRPTCATTAPSTASPTTRPSVTSRRSNTMQTVRSNTTSYPSMTETSQIPAGLDGGKDRRLRCPEYQHQQSERRRLRLCHQVGEWCDSPDLRTCNTTYAANKYKAPMRWCATAALNTDCRATWDSSRKYPRMPAPRIATIDVSAIQFDHCQRDHRRRPADHECCDSLLVDKQYRCRPNPGRHQRLLQCQTQRHQSLPDGRLLGNKQWFDRHHLRPGVTIRDYPWQPKVRYRDAHHHRLRQKHRPPSVLA